jgi:hypothetical protein
MNSASCDGWSQMEGKEVIMTTYSGSCEECGVSISYRKEGRRFQ